MSANRIFAEAMEDDDEPENDAENDVEPKPPAKVEASDEIPDPFDVAAMLKQRLEGDAEAADEELEWRAKGRAHFKPIIREITELLCRMVDGGAIEDVELKHYEPGEYGESGDVFYPERIEFSWRTTSDDHRYSNVPDYSITLVTGILQ